MDWLEEELKQALARKEPSPDFESRVRSRTRRKTNVVMMTRRWMAAAAAVVVLVGAGEGYRWHRGQEAKDQVMLAMRIAGGKLNRVQMEMKGNRQ
jgi:hypothetical protein